MGGGGPAKGRLLELELELVEASTVERRGGVRTTFDANFGGGGTATGGDFGAVVAATWETAGAAPLLAVVGELALLCAVKFGLSSAALRR